MTLCCVLVVNSVNADFSSESWRHRAFSHSWSICRYLLSRSSAIWRSVFDANNEQLSVYTILDWWWLRLVRNIVVEQIGLRLGYFLFHFTKLRRLVKKLRPFSYSWVTFVLIVIESCTPLWAHLYQGTSGFVRKCCFSSWNPTQVQRSESMILRHSWLRWCEGSLDRHCGYLWTWNYVVESMLADTCS